MTRARAPRGLIALDLDGTLEDSRDDMVDAVLRVRAAWELPPRPGDDFRPHVNRGMPHLYRACFGELQDAGAQRRAALRAAYTADYAAHIADRTRLYPGVAAAVDALAELAPLALVTNKPEELSDRLLQALGLRARFTAVIGGDTCAEPKPSALPLRTAAERCGVDPTRAPVIMIGDSSGDIQCGRALGAVVIWCAWGYKDEPGPLPPDHRAETPGQLPALARAILDAPA